MAVGHDKGYQEDTLHSIVDVQFDKDDAVKNGFYYNCNGRNIVRKTMRGVNLFVAINAGKDPKGGGDRITKEWIPFKVMKQFHPLETAEFAWHCSCL